MKEIRRKWKTKANNLDLNLEQPQTLEPGECISVDMVMSQTPGFIAQMNGKLTTGRYTCATIYVDMASKFGYLVLQRTASATETLRGKQEFEGFSRSVGVKITGYHANSVAFRANQWQESCHLQRQRLTYSSTHAHFKNGVAEGNIRILKDLARTMMAKAQIRWPQSISTILWPYAMRHAQHNINHAPSPLLPKKNTPFEA